MGDADEPTIDELWDGSQDLADDGGRLWDIIVRARARLALVDTSWLDMPMNRWGIEKFGPSPREKALLAIREALAILGEGEREGVEHADDGEGKADLI